MSTFLFIWMVTARTTYTVDHGWVNAGVFYNAPACARAAVNLGLKDGTFRCIEQASGETK